MDIKITAELAVAVAAELYQRLKRGGNFSFPTGRTMDPVYERLVALHKANPLNPNKVHAFMVDEYEGLQVDDPRSYTVYLAERVFKPLGIQQVHSVLAPHYDETIRSLGGMDLQLLGLGLNGHIAFNEPGSLRESRTRRVEIAEATRVSNASLFNSLSEVPTHAISMGIATILDAKEVWVLASGSSKAEIVKQLVATKNDVQLPASHLQGHANCTLWLDAQSAKLLN